MVKKKVHHEYGGEMLRRTTPLLILLALCACDDNAAVKGKDADLLSVVDSDAVAPDEPLEAKDDNLPPDEVLIDVDDPAAVDTDTATDDENDTIGPADDEADLPDDDVDVASNEPCTIQFGLPNEKTGLTAEQCRPLCNCEGKYFQPPLYTEEEIAKLLAMVPVDPPAEVTEDPYDTPEAHQPVPGSVCGLFLDDTITNGYRLETFASDTAAIAAGAYITHWDGCGVCSTLVNLVVYMRNPDLTDPVRQCGIDNMFNKNGNIECLQGLGFELPCAQIWYYNTQHTQSKCFSTCMAAVNDPYHNPDGTLNDCLLCDEVNSGPVFKAVAGRNRRNTGLPSSMCRPCAEVQPVFHYYW